MIALKNSMTGAAPGATTTIHSHDFAFYNQRILETNYQVDDNLIKDYFPFDTVTEGTQGGLNDSLIDSISSRMY